ncbi:MAG: tRNA uridine-5-carboxymethylaminomethyl(34) synthesis GTPase MnmE [Deltaproteobacteria bacterium]|nr:tRNA uridine-5-carboxymethylaminomethyl(34) synthesis GTPase MnmE [Deltaproteobacteria bacterium]
MDRDWNQDSIVAIATPPGEGGVGILRLSGPRSPDAASLLWRGNLPMEALESHRLYLGTLLDAPNGTPIDQALLVRMRAPRSYTGEEVVEIHTHGGPLLLNRVLESLLGQGLRAAEPGEFTRRAFLNGKMDLLQAEAVAELIHAKSEAALRNARAQLEGRLSKKVQAMRQDLLRLCAQVEAAIDFPEEDIEPASSPSLAADIRRSEQELTTWLDKFQVGRLLREGVRVAFVGRPNVGKSSLLNRLLEEDRAIVHDRPGTTRDVIEAWMEWGGVSFQLYDTAGIREGEEEVEREGIRRSERAAQEADLVLWVLDASQAPKAEDLLISGWLKGRVLIVGNKSDLVLEESPRPVQGDFPIMSGTLGPCWVSAKSGVGIPELKEAILQAVGLGGLVLREEAFLNNARHRQALLAGLEALGRARKALEERRSLELPAADLREAAQSMEVLLGKVSSDDILGEIFAHFCVGK